MSYTVRATVSKRNPYYLDKHRYYELKHFCLQYSQWKRAYKSLSYIRSSSMITTGKQEMSDPTPNRAAILLYLKNNMELVEKAAKMADEVMWEILLIGVTSGIPYEKLRARIDIPCCKNTYYNLYRKFFYILHKQKLHLIL